MFRVKNSQIGVHRCGLAVVVLAMTGMASAQPLTGELRKSIVESGVKTCIEKQIKDFAENEDFLKKAGISKDRVDLYCRCAMEYMADVVTPSEVSDLYGGTRPPSLQSAFEKSGRACAPLLRTVTRE